MSHPLSSETGGDAYDAMVEKDRLIKIINECCNADRMNPNEQGFIAQMETETGFVSPRQLLWLRDIKDKYLL